MSTTKPWWTALPQRWSLLTPREQRELAYDATSLVLNEYQDPKFDVVADAGPPDDCFLLLIEPDYRTSTSPTGGVTGRYLSRGDAHGEDYGEESSVSSGSSPFSPLGPLDLNVPARQALDKPSPQTGRPVLKAEDRSFVISRLNGMVDLSSKTRGRNLVPAHQGRPGRNIIRTDRFTNELYACIPCNPFAPEKATSRTEYNLRTYDEYYQGSMGQEPRKLYPAAPGSSLARCTHCTATSVLQNEALCPYHAYFLATGEFLGYYEFCTLFEMEKRGMSFSTGWWTVDEMATFVPMLTDWLRRWSLLMNSEPLDLSDTYPTRSSPFGPIGGPVPASSQFRSGRLISAQLQLLQKFSGRLEGNETKMGPELTKVYKQATGPSELVRRVSAKRQTSPRPTTVHPRAAVEQSTHNRTWPFPQPTANGTRLLSDL